MKQEEKRKSFQKQTRSCSSRSRFKRDDKICASCEKGEKRVSSTRKKKTTKQQKTFKKKSAKEEPLISYFWGRPRPKSMGVAVRQKFHIHDHSFPSPLSSTFLFRFGGKEKSEKNKSEKNESVKRDRNSNIRRFRRRCRRLLRITVQRGPWLPLSRCCC